MENLDIFNDLINLLQQPEKFCKMCKLTDVLKAIPSADVVVMTEPEATVMCLMQYLSKPGLECFMSRFFPHSQIGQMTVGLRFKQFFHLENTAIEPMEIFMALTMIPITDLRRIKKLLAAGITLQHPTLPMGVIESMTALELSQKILAAYKHDTLMIMLVIFTYLGRQHIVTRLLNVKRWPL